MPDESEWGKLKSGGLWTPGGTVLLGQRNDKDKDGGSEMEKETAGLDLVLSLRFHVNDDAATEVFWEYSKIETGSKTSLWQTDNKSTASWFMSAASALLQHKDSRGGL